MFKNALRDTSELANKQTEQLYKVSSPCLDGHQFKKEELESKSLLANRLENACIWCELVGLTFYGPFF